MLVTFECDAHERFTMFGDVAVKLIKMMGQSGTVPSAILAADVGQALKDLKDALDLNEETKMDAKTETGSVSLKTRAWPLIEMLEAADKAQANIMWREA